MKIFMKNDTVINVKTDLTLNQFMGRMSYVDNRIVYLHPLFDVVDTNGCKLTVVTQNILFVMED